LANAAKIRCFLAPELTIWTENLIIMVLHRERVNQQQLLIRHDRRAETGFV
jgi:hypothetical protein